MAWEIVPAGCQRRNDLAESRVKVSKVALKRTLFKMLRGEDSTLSHGGLCAILAMTAHVASDRPVALRSRIRRNLGAPLEPQAVQDAQYPGASRHQQDLVNLWWNPWRSRDLPAYGPTIT